MNCPECDKLREKLARQTALTDLYREALEGHGYRVCLNCHEDYTLGESEIPDLCPACAEEQLAYEARMDSTC